MDRRVLLALGLIMLVLMVPSLLIPPSMRSGSRRPASAARIDSTTTPPGAGAGAAQGAAPTTAVAPPGPAATPAPGASARNSSDTLRNAAGPEERTPVATEKARYAFSNRGAAPVTATLTEYVSLRRTEDRAPLALTREGEPLLRYRLLVGRDTVPLDLTTFTLREDRDPAGQPRLTYQAPTSAGALAIAYTFAPDSYLVRVEGRLEGASPAATPAYLLVELPRIRSAEADTGDDANHLAFVSKGVTRDAEGVAFSKLAPDKRTIVAGPLSWVASKNKYFVVGLLADSGDTPFAELRLEGRPKAGKLALDARATAIQELRDGAFGFSVYAGPQEWERLVALGRDFEHVNPYGGWFQGIVQPFATIVMRILLAIKRTTGLHYGWVLVLFGVAVRLLLWPLNQSAMRSSMKMQVLQPQLQELQKRYLGKDQQRYQQEVMKVYKEHGMSPFSPLAGCVPMLIPMPVLFALFFVFQNTIEFRGVPFLWLPDISLHDPYYVLPILMGLSMFLLSWIGTRGLPPNPQTKMLNYMMPVMMTVLLLRFASGLNLYYTVQNLAALPQQWLIARERKKTTPVGAVAPAKS